jgi:hypothetical protein
MCALPRQICLSPAEHHLLTYWLDRLSTEPSPGDEQDGDSEQAS